MRRMLERHLPVLLFAVLMAAAVAHADGSVRASCSGRFDHRPLRRRFPSTSSRPARRKAICGRPATGHTAATATTGCPGLWVAPPRVGFLWTPGYWGFGSGVYGWHAGYWGPHVGFYGGINYGFGYGGVGFCGRRMARRRICVQHRGVARGRRIPQRLRGSHGDPRNERQPRQLQRARAAVERDADAPKSAATCTRSTSRARRSRFRTRAPREWTAAIMRRSTTARRLTRKAWA